jgi:hypothetical protein
VTRKLIIIFLTTGIIVAMIFGIKRIDRFSQIDSCLDRGGRWNYELNECEKYYDIKKDELSKLYWHTDYDTISNKEILIKGKLIDSTDKSPDQLIEILNKRKPKPRIEFIGIVSDTIHIRILNDEYLTEQMGTTGAYCYLGETVYTLTENKLINYVKIEMDPGTHASPGVYNRNDFRDLIRKTHTQ